MEQTSNLKLPLINVNNAEDLKITFINFVKMICGVDDSSALQILDKTIKNLQNTKQDTLTAGENITIVNNVISGQGGVKSEDVLNIIEENAEQTDTLDIGTSATFDATSDEQIPTSKAVSDLMASASGGGSSGGSKLYEHSLSLYIQGNNNRIVLNYLNNDSTPFTIETFKALNNTELFNTNGLEVHSEKNTLQFVKGYYLENGNLKYIYQKIYFTITDNIITWNVNPNLGYSSIITIYSLEDSVREL